MQKKLLTRFTLWVMARYAMCTW